MGEIKYCKIHHDPQLSDTALFSEADALLQEGMERSFISSPDTRKTEFMMIRIFVKY